MSDAERVEKLLRLALDSRSSRRSGSATGWSAACRS